MFLIWYDALLINKCGCKFSFKEDTKQNSASKNFDDMLDIFICRNSDKYFSNLKTILKI